ncbi:hypothetical protein SUGI_1074310 [Cryptomeria japonica]|uniref:uncharacterized protein At1g66480 n=1 Tax=Cryptomeria japonica TaxID=3369 RepID=UPI002414B8EC|nr:uncharacterized protein At1g66480 [Cryptomeria japonica]GLJ50405.1 hypothetical protein SUGI_1074310 [Cryptomeria japonica]
MGNAAASSRAGRQVKVMKLDGEVLKFKSPITVDQLLQDYPNHVVLLSDAVRHVGVRARPLEGSTQLMPKQLYFLLEMPKIEAFRGPGRVRSGINMSAQSRLEAMLLARRSSSDITGLTSSSSPCAVSGNSSPMKGEDGSVRVKVRVSKAQLARMTLESENSSETAAKILDLCLDDAEPKKIESFSPNLVQNQGFETPRRSCTKTVKNRVRFHSDVPNAEVY